MPQPSSSSYLSHLSSFAWNTLKFLTGILAVQANIQATAAQENMIEGSTPLLNNPYGNARCLKKTFATTTNLPLPKSSEECAFIQDNEFCIRPLTPPDDRCFRIAVKDFAEAMAISYDFAEDKSTNGERIANRINNKMGNIFSAWPAHKRDHLYERAAAQIEYNWLHQQSEDQTVSARPHPTKANPGHRKTKTNRKFTKQAAVNTDNLNDVDRLLAQPYVKHRLPGYKK